MNAETFKKNYSIQTIHRAVKILKAFTNERHRISLTELNKITGINTSSLQRLLSTLVFEGLLQRDVETKQYQLGLTLFFLGEMVERNSSLLSVAHPIMEELNYKTTETISLNVIENNERRCLYNLKSKHELMASTYVGNTAPLYAGASAKVLLASLPSDELENYLSEVSFIKMTEKTIDSKEKLILDLNEINNRGYAISFGERIKGATSISAPVLNPFLEVIASITVTIPDARMSDCMVGSIIEDLLKAASTLSGKLR